MPPGRCLPDMGLETHRQQGPLIYHPSWLGYGHYALTCNLLYAGMKSVKSMMGNIRIHSPYNRMECGPQAVGAVSRFRQKLVVSDTDLSLPVLTIGPGMQGLGPACIFLRKGIAEKQGYRELGTDEIEGNAPMSPLHL
ncbi:hypothetical protein XENTR_v10022993 [Xenopus tropicalis]|nr:hypothetical protein XENTR_v10022993 [Xenopus tropicalis]